VRDLLFAFPCPPRLTPPPLLFARSIFCHPDRSGPAFSGARFLGAGSSSGGTVATSQPNRDRWDPTDQLSASLFASSTSNPHLPPAPLRKLRKARRLRPRTGLRDHSHVGHIQYRRNVFRIHHAQGYHRILALQARPAAVRRPQSPLNEFSSVEGPDFSPGRAAFNGGK
jgi:hypothetical protein